MVAPHEILFDAPPVAREVEFNVDDLFPKENRYRPLGEVSPVIRTLATEQFDDYVKRVRIFAPPRVVADLRGLANLPELLAASIGRMGQAPRVCRASGKGRPPTLPRARRLRRFYDLYLQQPGQSSYFVEQAS